MGSGKGKTRRGRAVMLPGREELVESQLVAQTNTKVLKVEAEKTAGAVTYVEGKWEEFVRDAILGPVRMDHYYLGRASRLRVNGDYEQMLSKLFADAVDVGAVVLPGSYVAENFEFVVDDVLATETTGGWYKPKSLTVRLKNKSESLRITQPPHGHFFDPQGYFRPGCGLSGVTIPRALQDISEGINRLLNI